MATQRSNAGIVITTILMSIVAFAIGFLVSYIVL